MCACTGARFWVAGWPLASFSVVNQHLPSSPLLRLLESVFPRRAWTPRHVSHVQSCTAGLQGVYDDKQACLCGAFVSAVPSPFTFYCAFAPSKSF